MALRLLAVGSLVLSLLPLGVAGRRSQPGDETSGLAADENKEEAATAEREAEAGDMRFLVKLKFKGDVACTGTVQGNKVLTASHCFAPEKGDLTGWIVSVRDQNGREHELAIADKVDPNAARYLDPNRETNPDLQNAQVGNHDLTILSLAWDPLQSPLAGIEKVFISPHPLVEGQEVTLGGYGIDQNDWQKNRKITKGARKLAPHKISKPDACFWKTSWACAKSTNGIASCEGDSGGPWFLTKKKETDAYVVVAVNSNGHNEIDYAKGQDCGAKGSVSALELARHNMDTIGLHPEFELAREPAKALAPEPGMAVEYKSTSTGLCFPASVKKVTAYELEIGGELLHVCLLNKVAACDIEIAGELLHVPAQDIWFNGPEGLAKTEGDKVLPPGSAAWVYQPPGSYNMKQATVVKATHFDTSVRMMAALGNIYRQGSSCQ